MSSMKSKPQAAGAGKVPASESGNRPTQASMSPIMTSHELPVKVEDKMDESQLNRLATGVTVDTGAAASTAVSLLTCSCTGVACVLTHRFYRRV